MIIPLIIQTIGLYPSGAVWTDEAPNVSRLDPSGAVQIDAEHPTRNRKVVGSNPTSGSKTPGQRISSKTSTFGWIRRWQPEHLKLTSTHMKWLPLGEGCGRAGRCASSD